MSENNFMTTRTEIEGCLEKQDALLSKVASLTADVCIARANEGKLSSSLEKDISNLLIGFGEEDKVKITVKVIAHLMRNGKFKGNQGSSSQDRDSKSSSRDIFKNRGFY